MGLIADDEDDRFHHLAAFYRNRDELLATVVPFVEQGVATGEDVLVALPADNLEAVRTALGPAAGRVRLADMAELGRNPARIIPAWAAFLQASRAQGRATRGVGEPIWVDRDDDELVEGAIHEALLNLAFDGGPPWQLLCPYDAAGLDDRVLRRAERTHPALVRDGEIASSPCYEAHPDVLATYPLPAPPERHVQRPIDGHQLWETRAAVARQAEDAGLDPDRVRDLVLAANELVANTLRHAGGVGVLRTWSADDRVVCQVEDGGRILDPLVGRRRPTVDQVSGRGLWIANTLCDLVPIRSTPAGSEVRLHMRLA